MSEKQRPPGDTAPPQIVLQQGQHALGAAAAAASEEPQHHDPAPNQCYRSRTYYDERPIEDVPPPPYDAGQYGEINISQNGMDTGATVGRDGRVNIKIKEKGRTVTSILAPILAQHQYAPQDEPEPEIPEGLGMAGGLPPPPMNIVIQIVGSRGDVQPFIALGQVLKKKFNHRVRIATHPNFRQFVTDSDLEFFSIGGDPAELMAFMVKNPGLMPGIDSIKAGDIGKRRKTIYEMINGCWRSCIEAGDGTGVSASDDLVESLSTDSGLSMGDDKPFVADAIIANPPSFAHIHIAEKLGIPLHLMFTMPWSPTQAFPHPLANIVSSNTDQSFANYISYVLVDMLTWQGLGDLINKFRERILHLDPVSIIWAPGMLARLKIPWTYCWSPALIPKPRDWSNKIDISGFFFLNLATNYTPDPDLAQFLEAGPPPVYIGFGSIVVDDPNAMTTMIFEAVKKTGQRALVSKGWGGLGADELGIPEGVFMLGNCPHDWLFQRVSAVVHHGGAGTTAAGIAAGCPTVVVPFFGDQPFWGAMTAKAGAGPMPIPYKELTADKLAGAITEALRPQSKDRAIELSNKIKQESGADTGADSFHKHLGPHELRCSICPGKVAVWRVRRTDIRLSALAATVLGNEGLLTFEDLKLYRPCEYHTDSGPPEPISGGAASLIGMFSEIGAGVMDMPSELLKSLKFGEHKKDGNTESGSGPTRADSLAPPGQSKDHSRSPSVSARSTGSATSDVEAKDKQPEQAEDLPDRDDSTYASMSPGVMSPRSQTSQPHAMSSVYGAEASSSPSRSHSRSASPNRAAGGKSPHRGSEAGQMTLESLIGATKAGGKIAKVGLKSPMDFTMSLAQGFHNAPKLYGDTTVRKPAKITDFRSGLAAAGKEFGYGFYDGISGLVTQPMKGAQKEGAAGFVKGFARGAFGLVLKPGASIWGLPGYTFKGIYMELTKHLGSSTQNYIIAARTAQGYEDWKQSGAGERERIVATWKSLDKKRSKQKYRKEKTNETTKKDDKEKKKLWKKGSTSGNQRVSSAAGSEAPLSSADLLAANEADFEEAIKRSVKQTSKGNPQEDKVLERALRASVNTLRNNPEPITDENEEEAYRRAMQASVEEAERARTETGNDRNPAGAAELPTEVHVDRSVLQNALNRSAGDDHEGDQKISMVDYDDDEDTENDEDYKRAVEASRQSTGGSHAHRKTVPPPAYTEQETGSTSKSGLSDEKDDPDYELKQALAASMAESSKQISRKNSDDDDDEEFRRAMTASEQESKDQEAAREKQKTEEEIVLEYIKKQSLMEEEHRQKMQQ
ncbi:hypothetical protein PMZ80_009037 [Knufia obscura]|uniref:Glycosyltransferase family 28 N-terminal domain-containing protein n=2 Tax=Knufia TaxID=430999 RepID=A0AAN8EGG1_9EURO|nr:hypothetical protein PMZ80_009037 [Knufia obscura]KAK5955008.1 hypothetical protein OHC33_003687 [Knufia fluminis]